MDSVIIREASFDDESAVQCLCQRNGRVGERSDQAWRWIWRKNRFYSDSWKIGWVLESGGVVVGFRVAVVGFSGGGKGLMQFVLHV